MKNDTLKIILEEYTYKIRLLKNICLASQRYDGKTFNKNFVNLLESIPDIVANINTHQGLDKYHSLDVWASSLSPSNKTLIHIFKCEEIFLEDNRVNYHKFKEHVFKIQTQFEKISQKIQNDIQTGDCRLKEWNKLIEKLNILGGTFSSEFIYLYRHDFQQAVIL